MNYGNILRNLNKHIHLKRSEIDYFTSLLAQKEIPKNKLILEEGQSCTYINYVQQGAFRPTRMT